MRVLVIGAHHGLGAVVVATARARAMSVTPFEGDVLDPGAVERFLAGIDAVVSTLGPRQGSASDVCSRGTRHLVEAMRARGVRRLVQVTGAVVGHPASRLGLLYGLIARTVPRSLLEDRRKAEGLVLESGLDWTLVRPTRLTDGPPRGTWRDGGDERVGAFAKIARADAADAIVRALADPSAVGCAWTLQY